MVRKGHLNETNVEEYADFLNQNFSGFSNIFWVVGGDCRGDIKREVWDKLGMLLKQKMPGRIIGYHPFGRLGWRT